MIAQILTPYTGSGTVNDPHRPLIADTHKLAAWSDITGTPVANLVPAPNLLVVQATMDAATLDAIKADSKFVVLWSGEKPDTKPIATEEITKLRGYLEASGVTTATAATVVKAAPRDKVATDLATWLKARPQK